MGAYTMDKKDFHSESVSALNKAHKLFRKELNESLTYHKAVPFVTKIGHFGKVIGGGSNDKIWNSIEKIKSKNYRQRVEALIFNDKRQILLSSDDPKYKIIGGATEPDMTMEQAVYKEGKEEAFIKIKDITYTNIMYSDKLRPGHWLHDVTDIEYEGHTTYVFVGKYAGEFKGNVKDHDVDEKIKNSKWYDIDKVYSILREPHKKVIDQMRDYINRIA
jgi:8-oxo-dGTP pyrophosphatase MutT (NUDIX family)